MGQTMGKEKLSFKAIFVGWFVMANVLSGMLQILIDKAAGLILQAQGYGESKASAILADSLFYCVFALVWEFVFTGLGGYMVTRLAG